MYSEFFLIKLKRPDPYKETGEEMTNFSGPVHKSLIKKYFFRFHRKNKERGDKKKISAKGAIAQTFFDISEQHFNLKQKGGLIYGA